MAPQTINVLLTSFPGLGLPPTFSLPLSADSTVSDLTTIIESRIPSVNNRLLLTTNSNKLLSTSSSQTLSTLLSSQDDTFLPLRLSAPLCGGKGGFGSQLRAAGGKMSSARRKAGGANNGSNRNLDGRRLRSVAEAKALAEYLAVKPEMDKKEKEEKRRRWQEIVDVAERKEEEVREGRTKARLDGKWVEAKEEAEKRTQEAILKALESGGLEVGLGRSSDESPNASGEDEESESEEGADPKEEASKGAESKNAPVRKIFGWDEDEDMSDEDESEDEIPAVQADAKGKGKAKA